MEFLGMVLRFIRRPFDGIPSKLWPPRHILSHNLCTLSKTLKKPLVSGAVRKDANVGLENLVTRS